jgi:tetratricopeptide (TPR) repeat protein
MNREIRMFCAIAIFMTVAAFGFTAGQNGKLPITTSSEKAKSEYLKGLDLADKLRAQDSSGYFRKATQEDPKFAVAYLNLAFTEPSRDAFFKDVNQALAHADNASEGERLWILSADAAAKGQPNKQGEYLQKLVAAYPQDERAHNLLAVYYFGLQQYDNAIREFQKAVSINPEFAPSYNMLGYSYRFNDQLDKSEQAFRKYIELIPNDPNPYDSYAELLMKMGRYDESIDNYRKALQQDTYFSGSYVGIATNFNFKGEHEKAREELQKLYDVARTDSERRTALLGMTISYLDEGNSQKALEEQDKMLAVAKKMNDPTNVTGDLNTIGTILLESGHAQEAQVKFDEAAKATEDSGVSPEVKKIAARNHIFFSAKVALASNDLKKAHADAADFQKQAEAEKNRFLIWLAHELNGTIALSEKKYDAAIQELQQSNQLDPYNIYRLALAYQGKGDTANAKKFFERTVTFNGLNNLNYGLIRTKAKESAAKVS